MSAGSICRNSFANVFTNSDANCGSNSDADRRSYGFSNSNANSVADSAANCKSYCCSNGRTDYGPANIVADTTPYYASPSPTRPADKEFETFMKDTGHSKQANELTEDDLSKVLMDMDTNGDSQISFPEVLAAPTKA